MNRLRVGIIVDSSNTYGRSIIRGVTSYANLQRRWILFKDLEQVFSVDMPWPDLDGAIFAGVPTEVFESGRRHCRFAIYCSGGAKSADVPVICLDDVMVGRMAADHLLDCRIKHFGFYGCQPDYKTAVNRLAGFKQRLEEQGYTCNPCPLPRPLSKERISHCHRPALVEWLRSLSKPAGVLAFDDTVAHDLAEACLEADIGVPDHVAIIGVNNDDLLCESSWPPLSSVDANFQRIGYTAAKALDRLLSGEQLGADAQLTLLPPVGVVRRQSTDTLAIQDGDVTDALRYIRDHACEPCTVQDVLKQVPIGRRSLERQFTLHLGRSPHQEIIRVRMEAAQRLLLRSDLDTLDISSKCGFSELKSFYTAFRKATGTTPAAFRRSQSAKPRKA